MQAVSRGMRRSEIACEPPGPRLLQGPAQREFSPASFFAWPNRASQGHVNPARALFEISLALQSRISQCSLVPFLPLLDGQVIRVAFPICFAQRGALALSAGFRERQARSCLKRQEGRAPLPLSAWTLLDRELPLQSY